MLIGQEITVLGGGIGGFAAAAALAARGARVKVLEQAGLITRRIDGTRRPCRLAGAPLEEVEAWLNGLRTMLEARYSRLDDVLAEMQAEATPPSKLSRAKPEQET